MVDLAAIIARDNAATDDVIYPDPLRSMYEDETRAYDVAYDAIDDRRTLLGLLNDARRALDSVGNCHGCIQNGHDESLALLNRLDDAFEPLPQRGK